MQNIQKHEVLFMKAAVRQTTQGEDGEWMISLQCQHT